MVEVVPLTKLNRKFRRKYRVGTLAIYGAEELAKKVRENWEAGDKDEWARSYREGVENPDWDTGETLLAEWYKELERYSAELSREVAKVYAKIRASYLSKKKGVIKRSVEVGKVVEVVAR